MICSRKILAMVTLLTLAGRGMSQAPDPAKGNAAGGSVPVPATVVEDRKNPSPAKPAPTGDSPEISGPPESSASPEAKPDAPAEAVPEATETAKAPRRAPARRPARSTVRRSSAPQPRAVTAPNPPVNAEPVPKAVAAPAAKPTPAPASDKTEARPFLTEYQDTRRDQETPVGRLILDLVVKLAIVLGIAYGSLYVLRGFMARQGVVPGRTGHLRVLETASLGPNRSVHLVRVGGKVIIVGSTPEQVTPLGDVDDPETLALLTGDGAGGSFSSHLSGVLSREGGMARDDGALTNQVRGGARHLWDQVQEIRGLRGRGGRR